MADTAYSDDAKADALLLGVAEAAHQIPNSNKRKRVSAAHDVSRPAPAQRGAVNNVSSSDLNDQSGASFLNTSSTTGDDDDMHNFSGTDLSALAQHNSNHNLHQNGGGNAGGATDTAAAALHHYSMTVPQATELSFQSQPSTADHNASFNMGDSAQGNHSMDYGLDALKEGSQQANPNQSPPSGGSAMNKPAVGSEEWHKVRRDNHKEVERRRRETINEGINELAKIVPGCEKNKGSILQRAVQFITQLKENESQNIEKWTLEKLLTEQAIAELSASCDKFKAECQRAWAEREIYKRACEKAGVVPDEYKGQEGEQEEES